ncbi:MAG TPA: outer membrane beta-barrel protein [Bryobacteraceae bacterium]|jgi:hypothetical protein|nr:outer membrane beta-barrel protein [Bryobacteraceae bacterium]
MKEVRTRFWRFTGFLAASSALFVTSPALWAQAQQTSTPLSSSSSSSVPEIYEQTLPRVWVGLSANFSPLKLFTGSTSINSTTGQIISTTVANGEAGGGLNINLHLLHNYWLNVGGAYYFGGYDRSNSLNDAAGTLYVERTRARMFDFPVLVRYTGSKFRWSRYSFYELGGALRYASSVDVHETAVDTNGYFCCAPASDIRVRKATGGVTIGTGIVFKDDFGIKSAPEIRYTRWLDSTFAGPTVGTMRNQLEIAITLGR